MKMQRGVGLVMLCIVLPDTCALLAFVFYVVSHPGPVPRWITVSLVCFIVFTGILGTFVVRRLALKRAVIETPDERDLRRNRALKWLKVGLVFYLLAMLNGIRVVLQGEIPWRYSIPGFTIDILLIVAFWISIRRLKSAEMATDSNIRTGGPQS
jgi:hypothetical protein